MTFFEFITLLLPAWLSIAAIAVAVQAWRKKRVMYEVISLDDKLGKRKINALLETGKYTVVHVQADPLNTLNTIYTLARIAR